MAARRRRVVVHVDDNEVAAVADGTDPVHVDDNEVAPAADGTDPVHVDDNGPAPRGRAVRPAAAPSYAHSGWGPLTKIIQ